jgi:hypothetical protein
MRPVDVEHRDRIPPGMVFSSRRTTETVVLRRCTGTACGNLDSIVLNGNWTLEQTRGQTLSAATLPMAAVPGGGHVYRAEPARTERST